MGIRGGRGEVRVSQHISGRPCRLPCCYLSATKHVSIRQNNFNRRSFTPEWFVRIALRRRSKIAVTMLPPRQTSVRRGSMSRLCHRGCMSRDKHIESPIIASSRSRWLVYDQMLQQVELSSLLTSKRYLYNIGHCQSGAPLRPPHCLCEYQ